MELVGGPLGVGAIAGVVALLIVLAVLHFRFHVFRRRKHRARHKTGMMASGRIEVLETTVIDAERRLVLVRCDQVEHLIVVGGPNDVVVENDVRKLRGPGTPPAKSITLEPSKLTASPPRPTQAASPLTAAISASPSAPEPHRQTHRPAETRATPAGHRAPPSPQPPLARNAPATAKTEEKLQPRASAQRPSDAQHGRRDHAPLRMPQGQNGATAPSRHAETLRAQSGAPSGDRSARATPRPAGRGVEPTVGLPAAQIPWSDPDSIENEIVRALRFDPQTRSGGSASSGRREPPPAKPAIEPSATLGDIADRLEEALAREMQSASPARQADIDLEDFNFDTGAESQTEERAQPATKERPERQERQDRPERRERAEPQKAAIAPAPEPEQRREAPPQAERREETPVISLSSRRREAADPLEDEMARLLGELTSDTKSR